MVVSKQTTETVVTFDLADRVVNSITRFDDSVGQALVISFNVKMIEIIGDSPSQRLLSKESHSGEAFAFEASEESLKVSIEIGTSRA